MIYYITPVPKPRMTGRDKWLNPPRPCVQRYRDFADEIKIRAVRLSNGCSITFGMPIPKSRKKGIGMVKHGQPHIQTPDIDNLLKALLDAIFGDDSHIWHIGSLKKVWSAEPYILIEEE